MSVFSSLAEIQYRPLQRDVDEIRLLRVHDQDGPLVRCSLEYHSLNDYKDVRYPSEFSNGTKLKAWVAAQEARTSDNSLRQVAAKVYRVRNTLENIGSENKTLQRLNAFGKKVKKQVKSGESVGHIGKSLVDELVSGSLFAQGGSDDNRGFLALSYTWGDPRDTEKIVVDGKVVDVGRNLEAALRTFRDHPDLLDGCGIWVDQLCINQNDTKEKNRQVKRMRRIYKIARRVLIWLGPEADGSDVAIRTLYRIFADSVDWMARGSNNENVNKLLGDDFARQAVDSLLSRPYFQRLWVLQELAAKGGNALMVCGSQRIPWALVRRSAFILATYYALSVAALPDEATGDEHAHVTAKPGPSEGGSDEDEDERSGADAARVDDIVSALAQSDMQRVLAISDALLNRRDSTLNCLLSALYLGTSSKCVNDRDRIYGMLALLPREVVAAVQPDYSLAVRTVYEDFSKTVIQCTESLDFIHMGTCRDPRHDGATDGPDTCPSWVQDWRISRRRVVGDFDMSNTAVDASLDAKAEVEFPADGLLSCKGVLFDVLGAPLSAEGDPARAASHMRSPLDGCSRTEARVSLHKTLIMFGPRDRLLQGAKETLFAVAWRDDPSQQPFEDWLAAHGTHALERFEEFRQSHAQFRVGDLAFRELFRQPSESLGDVDKVRTGLRYAVPLLARRKLTHTQGGFVGFAPTEARDGDAIFVLAGSTFPVLLRPDSCGELGMSRYRVVGEVYVDGIMGGEVMKLAKKGVCPTTQVVLC
ncbi:hypothetical protein VTK73DRAFT_3649 [Phialemonium thermophilum]|uniref:Heterokaryon incompatibility domain-containing protein n=1 Tax=Phialemonium thermophilum TaxID=223376 RepID=A0ABR3WXN9_9PEZI